MEQSNDSAAAGREDSRRWLWRKAIAASELTSTQKLVAHTLALHMNADGGSCFPSIDTICSEGGLGRTAVKNALRELDREGWISRSGGGSGAGAGNTARYQATFPEKGRDVTLSKKVRLATQKGRLATEKGSARDPEVDIEEVREEDTAPCSPPRAGDETERRIDLVLSAFYSAAQQAPAVTSRALRRDRRAAKDLVVHGDATPEEVEGAVGEWQSRFDCDISVPALARNWHVLSPTLVAQARKPRPQPCRECGVGAGLHAADCPTLDTAGLLL